MDFICHLSIMYQESILKVFIYLLLIILKNMSMAEYLMDNCKMIIINLLIQIILVNIFFPFIEINFIINSISILIF